MKGRALYENGMSREKYLEQNIRQYEAFDYSDPMTTTDEELFGKWEKDRWAVDPLLDYERVKGLEKVAQAAKMGDYPECKRLILAYYNQKFDTFHFDAPQRPDEKTFLCLEMQMENFFVRPKYGPWPLDKMLVGKEHAWHETDILPAVQPLGAATDRLMTLHLYALKKDGYTAKFHSRKHEENRPFAEVTVNGEKRRYPAVMDTYLCGGSKRLENFGGEKLLLAEESYSSIHKEETADEYSRRAVLKFDFSDLGPEDKITEAVLHLHGWMEKSDNPVVSGIEKESKIVFVLNDPTGNLWDEKELVWQNLDNGGWVCFSYDGTPGYVNQSMLSYFPNLLQYRSSIMAFAHELQFFADCAAVERDDAAVFHVLRLMMHKTRQLHCDFTSTEQPTLNLFRVRCVPALVQKCRFSHFMTPEIFTTILKSVYEHCEAICGADRFSMHRSKIWTQDLKKANIGAIQTASLLQVAIIFDEFKAAYAPLGEEWEKESFNGGWFQVVRQRYEMCMKYSFLPDGAVTDIPVNYIWTNLWNYVEPLAEWGKNFHFDMRKVFTEEMIGKIIGVCEYAARITSPLYGGWQIGDAINYEQKQLNYLQDIGALFPEKVSDHLKYMASEGKAGMPAKETAMVSEETSRAVIRSDWTKDAVALHFQSNSHLYHTHNDDLSLILIAYGNYLLADPIRYLYVKTDAISNWQISRAAHNSILVDGMEPEKAGGSLHPEDRALNSIYDFLHGDSKGYPDHFQERYVCFVRPGYFIVTDHISSVEQEKHCYRQSWHFHPAAHPVLETGGIVQTHFEKKANLIVAPMGLHGELSHRLETGYYSREAQQTALEKYQYAVYEKEEAGDASFQTLLYPLRPGSQAAIEAKVLPCSCPAPDARAMRAVIRESGKEEIQVDYYIRMKGQGEASFGRYHTDGSMALVELACGNIRTLILRDGSFIWDRKAGKMVLRLNKQVKDVGISFANGSMQVECSDQDVTVTQCSGGSGNMIDFSQHKILLPDLISDNAVFQAGKPVRLWGYTEGNAEVRAEIRDDKGRIISQGATAKRNEKGKFELELPACPCSARAHTLLIQTEDECREINNVIFGDVWLLGGQSSMMMTAGEVRTPAVMEALHPERNEQIRFFSNPRKDNNAIVQGDNLKGEWVIADEESILPISLIGYGMLKKLHAATKRPMGGMINVVGGSSITAWVPGGLYYDSKVLPPAHLNIRGIAWYQGESDHLPSSPAHADYAGALQDLIHLYRKLWRDNNLPFLTVQLPQGYYYGDRPMGAQRMEYEKIRLQQMKAYDCMKNENVYLISSMDCRPNGQELISIHYDEKEPVWRRLAEAALDLENPEKSPAKYTGARVEAMEKQENALLIRFKDVGDGLCTRDGLAPWGFCLQTADGKCRALEAELVSPCEVLLRLPDGMESGAEIHYQLELTDQYPYALEYPGDIKVHALPNLVNGYDVPVISFRLSLEG